MHAKTDDGAEGAGARDTFWNVRAGCACGCSEVGERQKGPEMKEACPRGEGGGSRERSEREAVMMGRNWGCDMMGVW